MEDALSIELGALAGALGRPIPASAGAGLLRYAGLVRAWNAKMNLTAAGVARDPRALVEVLFADALMLSEEALLPRDARVLDVGSGAGAPAIGTALLRPDLRFVLLEPLRKRVAFLRTAVGTLDLVRRVEVREEALDLEVPAVSGSPFDVAMARATFAPEPWSSAGAKIADRVVVFRAGPLEAASPEIARREYVLPRSGAHRVLVVTKSSETRPG